MKTLRFEGSSDDTFSCRGPGIDVDHDDCATFSARFMLVKSEAGALVVQGQYGCVPNSGTWMIGIAPYDPDDSAPAWYPPWPIRFEAHPRGYSTTLVMDCPDDVTVELMNADEESEEE